MFYKWGPWDHSLRKPLVPDVCGVTGALLTHLTVFPSSFILTLDPQVQSARLSSSLLWFPAVFPLQPPARLILPQVEYQSVTGWLHCLTRAYLRSCVCACVRVSVCADAPPSASAVCLSQLMSLPVPVSATTRYCSFCFYSKTIYIQCGQRLMLVIIFSTYGLCDYKKPKQITPVDDKYLHIFSLCIWPVRTRKV